MGKWMTAIVMATGLATWSAVAPGEPEARHAGLLAQVRSQPSGSSGVSKGALPTPPPSGPPQPLAGPMAIEPGTGPKIHVAPPTSAEMKELHNAIKAAAVPLAAAESHMDGLHAAQKSCKTKNYSVEDQKAAGCQPMDNLAQCSIKLYKHCMKVAQKNFPWAAKSLLEQSDQLMALVKKYQTRLQDAVNAFTP